MDGKMVDMGCQKDGSAERVNRCVMIMGDREVERDAPVDMCLQILEADSGQVDVLNSTPEGARTAVDDLHKEIFSHALEMTGQLEKSL